MVPKGVFNIKIAVEHKSFVDDVPMQNGDFTQQTVSLPEGIPFGNQAWLENSRNKWRCTAKASNWMVDFRLLLWMEEILHQLIDDLSHYL